MTREEPSTATDSPPIINDALAATNAALQIICDLEAILHLISRGAEAQVAQLADIGIRIANDARMDALDDGHLKLRMQLKEAGADGGCIM